MTTLAEATTPTGGTLRVDATWLQGRGAYGGLTVAAAIRAIEAHVADPRRRVRTVTAELPAPTVPGTASVEVAVLRSGANLTTARAAIRQGADVTTHAVVVLAADRDSGADVSWQELPPPPIGDWRSVPLAPMHAGGPAFAQHFEYRIVDGIPFTSAATQTLGWVRACDPGPARDAAYIAAMIDVWFPAALVRFSQPRPLATIAYTLEIVAGVEGLDPDEPLLYRGSVPVCRAGYFLETRELWGSDGRLVARNHQTFAIIR